MFELRCTVRNCCELLQQRDTSLFCAAGHHFDRAKEGYWSLLQPQDRRSKNPGDTDTAVLARHRWLACGYAAGLVDALRPWVTMVANPAAKVNLGKSAPLCQPVRTIDLGCGEGTFGRTLFRHAAAGYCGIDLSKRAIKLAARSWPDATWVLANADRTLPVADASVDTVISLFGRRPVAEIERVLNEHGVCIVAVPGEADLIELRQEVQQAANRRSRWKRVVTEMAAVGLRCIEHQTWSQCIELEPDAIADALAMTYRGVRHSQRQRLESLQAMRVTMAADLILLRRQLAKD